MPLNPWCRAQLYGFKMCIMIIGAWHVVSSSFAFAQTTSGVWSNGEHPDHCRSTKEFVRTLDFLRTQIEVQIPEMKAREIATKVAESCTGTADNFIQAFLMMKKSGVDYSKCVEVGLLFANEKKATLDNFYEIFQKTYLGEYFNMDFKTAMQVSYDLSKDYGDSNIAQARSDFLNLAQYCLDQKKMGLPAHRCAQLSVKLAKLSRYYPQGVFSPFVDTYQKLRGDKKFGLSVRSALSIIEEVLQYGPKASENFMEAYDYGLSAKGLGLSNQDSLKFAIAMAKLSSKTDPPPVVPPDATPAVSKP